MIALVSLVLTAMLQAEPPQITHERIGEDQYLLRLTARGVSTLEEAMPPLAPIARQLCGNLPAHFGRYRWEALDQLEDATGPRRSVGISIVQELSCGAAAAVSAETAAAPDPNWQPSPADEQRVLDASMAYFAAMDLGRFTDAYEMMGAGMRTSPLADFSERIRRFNERAGRPEGRRIIRVTWYNNPPTAPVPGIYAAADYDGAYEKLHFICGYLIWLLQVDGSWRLTREEVSTLARADAPNATREEIAALRPQVGRRD